MCKHCLKKKIAGQIRRLLTQVFTGGIIFPGLLPPHPLCKSQLTPVGTFLLSKGVGEPTVPMDPPRQEAVTLSAGQFSSQFPLRE